MSKTKRTTTPHRNSEYIRSCVIVALTAARGRLLTVSEVYSAICGSIQVTPDDVARILTALSEEGSVDKVVVECYRLAV